jgi:hypothetical protein
MQEEGGCTMKTQVRLNLYERGIVASLIQDHNFESNAARQLVVRYIKPIRKLGGYDSSQEHAERLVKAQQIGYSPDAWLKTILEIEREEMHDKGIPDREHSPEYAHL